MLDLLFELSDNLSFVLWLIFLIWWWLIKAIIKLLRKQRGETATGSEQEETAIEGEDLAEAEQREPDPDDAKLASRGKDYQEGKTYHDGDRPVHTENEALQHDKGRTYRDGDSHVHTEDEQLAHDKGRVFVDQSQVRTQLLEAKDDNNSYAAIEAVAEGLESRKQEQLKPARKKLVRKQLAEHYIMSEIFCKPKGLE